MAPPLSKATLNLRGSPYRSRRIQDVVVQRVGERRDVDEFGGIKARNRRSGDVANVVGAGTARSQAQRLHVVENAHNVFGLKLANLQIGARRDVGAAGTPVFGDIGQAAQLVCSENAAGNAQPQHERVLRGRNIKKPVKLESEHVFGCGRTVFVGMCKQFVPDIERILLVLPQLFAAQVGKRCPMQISRRVRPIGCARRRIVCKQTVCGLADERVPVCGASHPRRSPADTLSAQRVNVAGLAIPRDSMPNALCVPMRWENSSTSTPNESKMPSAEQTAQQQIQLICKMEPKHGMVQGEEERETAESHLIAMLRKFRSGEQVPLSCAGSIPAIRSSFPHFCPAIDKRFLRKSSFNRIASAISRIDLRRCRLSRCMAL